MGAYSDQLKTRGMCRFCLHFETRDDTPESAYGECRRHPPVVISTGDGGGLTLFPSVSGLDYCGEYEQGS